jgi:glycosyltransferase involved in cell wall biosynthesis
MVFYVSDSLGSKKNGGVSASGLEFLRFLCTVHKDVVVVSNNSVEDVGGADFYGHSVYGIEDSIVVKRRYPLATTSLLILAKKIALGLLDIFKSGSINLAKRSKRSKTPNILYVNSWSPLFREDILLEQDSCYKVCIVRGSPDSFIWQSKEDDKEAVVLKGAAVLDKYDALIHVSSDCQTEWAKYLTSFPKTYYLPNSINEEEVEEMLLQPVENLRVELGFSDDDFNVVAVGSLQKRKGQDFLVDQIDKMVKVCPNVKVHLIGIVSAVWGGFDIIKAIEVSEYAHHFVVHGHSESPLSFVHAADMVLFPSRAEAFPRTVAEYMAMSKPILSTKVSGSVEMIRDGENGRLYAIDNSEEFMKAFSDLCASGEIRKQLGNQARKDYYNNYAKVIHLAKAQLVFEEIIKDAGQASV